MSAPPEIASSWRRGWRWLRACVAAVWHADWRLAHDPVVGFVQGLRKRLRLWNPQVMDVGGARSLGAEGSDGVYHLEPPLDWEACPLPEVAAQAWDALRPGGWFLLRSRLPRHEVSAVVTAQGWLTGQVARVPADQGQGFWFVLQRPGQGARRGSRLDWKQERLLWTASAAIALERERPWGARPSALPRRCHVFGVGIAKGGTRSLAGLFGGYRSAHEAATAATIQQLALDRRQPGAVDWHAWVRARDRETGELECDSSQFHAWYAGTLVEVFPRAQFILTLREPLSWLRSFVDHRLARGLAPEWAPMQAVRFGDAQRATAAGEEGLADYGLPGLEALLGYWREHHQRVLEAVPPERLLVLPLARLGDRVEAIAAFAGVPPASLDAGNARLNEGGARFQVVERLPQAMLEEKIEALTGDLWRVLNARALR